jgi:hypothetical protein
MENTVTMEKPTNQVTTNRPRRAGLREAAAIVGLTVSELRCGAISGRYPHMRLGASGRGKMLFDLDLLEQAIKARMMANVVADEPSQTGKIRRIAL